MQNKKIYTRQEFEEERMQNAKKMHEDESLVLLSNTFLQKADEYKWIHQTSWLGEPCLQLPQDLFAIQEIIFKTKPQWIVEVGMCWGGTTLFLASMLQMTGGKGVVGIDVFSPTNVIEALKEKGKYISDDIRISIIEGSSIEQETIGKVNKIVDNDSCMVILDSHHTHEHVLKELEIYSEFISSGNYMVICDTIVEKIGTDRKRPWGIGNNPHTALMEFLSKNNQFRIDEQIRNKLLLSCQDNGYIFKK